MCGFGFRPLWPGVREWVAKAQDRVWQADAKGDLLRLGLEILTLKWPNCNEFSPKA